MSAQAPFNYAMIQLNDIVNQVLENCSICDSRHSGLYSVCGLALRLRDLYKWEKGLDPWVEKDSSEILEWIGGKEEEWDRLEGEAFVEITILGNTYAPFDSSGINAVLEPHSLFYGAGYVYSMRPTFFLATLEDKKEIDGRTVYILGRELARDLITVPALTQGECILIRKESARLFLWDQMFFIKKSGRDALRFALQHCGVNGQDLGELQRNITRISEDQIETYIYHELGEIKDPIFDRETWREIIATFPHTPIELLARTVKDLLADTNQYGTLRHIVKERKTASLGFYVAFLDGLRKELIPHLIDAFRQFTLTRDWQIIEHATADSFNTARYYADAICSIFQEGKGKNGMKWTQDEIQRRLLRPLGIIPP